MARRPSAVALLLAVAAAWPPPIRSAERTVELVLAESESQARVVGRAVRTGFFVDQLLIPGTSYLGRLSWSELIPSIRSTMEDARPGEPYLLTGNAGKLCSRRRGRGGRRRGSGRCSRLGRRT